MIPKDAPKVIYLQHDPENDGDTFNSAYTPEVTWCEKKVFDTDIKYIRADLVTLKLED